VGEPVSDDNIETRYLSLVREYIAGYDEKCLLAAGELGREMVLSGAPPEDVGQIHTQTLEQLVAETPEQQIRNIIDPASAPLLEMLMAYGLAYREKVETLERSRKKLQQLAHYDTLTNLPNRTAFLDRLKMTLSHAARKHRQLAVMFVDLDRFKVINDTRGHTIGDQLLVAVSDRLKECVRDEDTVSRLSGDEFTVLLSEVDESDRIERVAGRIVNKLSKPFNIEGSDIFITVSVGISVFPYDGVKDEILLQRADTAMYQAKEDGKNTFRFFDLDMNARIMERMKLETSLRQALGGKELSVHYQPKVDMKKQEIVGVESLLRWNNAKIGSISPEKFIPVAEETGLIVGIGEFVLREACQQVMKWHREGLGIIPVAVNLSARQFKDKHLLEAITGVLDETGLEPSMLEIELTESLVMDDVENNVTVLKKMKEIGLSISIDDFGTGYSSLAYLRKLPVDTIKIDRAFVSELTTNQNDEEIVSTIISMAQNLNLKIIAEGVETLDQINFLLRKGCNEGQGYYFSKPMSGKNLNSVIEKAQAARFPEIGKRAFNA